jgi:hypothetical protein
MIECVVECRIDIEERRSTFALEDCAIESGRRRDVNSRFSEGKSCHHLRDIPCECDPKRRRLGVHIESASSGLSQSAGHEDTEPKIPSPFRAWILGPHEEPIKNP